MKLQSGQNTVERKGDLDYSTERFEKTGQSVFQSEAIRAALEKSNQKDDETFMDVFNQ